MDRLAVLVGGTALALAASGCAQSVSSRTTITADDRIAVEPAPPPALPPNAFADEPAGARPRLSRTITLGQGSSETVYGTPAAAPPPSQAAGTDPNVTVHNHVTVVQPPVYYYGGYGGYGYGYGGGYGARGNGTSAGGARDGAGNTTQPRGAWAPNGWEGAGRTAAPGATPGVGGNFAPAPSFGPRQMK